MPVKVEAVIKICVRCNQPKSIETNRVKCGSCRVFESKLKRGIFRDPSYPEINTQNYKDPMQPVEDGFGYYGAITQTNDEEHIQCHVCGYFFANLAAHVNTGHKELSVREYKIKYGLRIYEGLLSPKEKERRQEIFNQGNRLPPGHFRLMAIKGAAARRAKGVQTGGNNWQPITRNEKGMCKEQTIAKIQAVAEVMDGVPTHKEFVRIYGTGQTSVVNYWFGSWKKALTELGYTHFNDRKKELLAERRLEIVEAINRFYTLYGRTPQWSDFRDIDWLPKGAVVSRLFGSFNNARAEAGVPLLVSHGRNWVEVQPGEETLGIVPGAARGRRATEVR